MYGYTLDMTYGKSWYWLSGNHDLTKLLYSMDSQLLEDTEVVIRFLMVLKIQLGVHTYLGAHECGIQLHPLRVIFPFVS